MHEMPAELSPSRIIVRSCHSSTRSLGMPLDTTSMLLLSSPSAAMTFARYSELRLQHPFSLASKVRATPSRAPR